MHHQFTCTFDQHIADINAQVRIYAHPSGATLMSVSNDDENKSFGVALRTLPASSNGIAHILEHAVLCGSQRYPVKSPFNELLKGSVNTFLNAMTYPDKTVYPVASTNQKDLYNLVSVYMDAVFFPLISEDTLRQEGWRYEFDEAGELCYKGVVYNEMKGASATAERITGRSLYQELLPDTIYAHDSGGNPRNIPQLSYAEFTEFHRTYYHPSNALIFWYGDDPEAERLAHLEPFLREFTAQTPPPPIATQPRWDAPRTARHPYPASAGEQRHQVTVAWLIDEMLSDVDQMELSILDHALLHDAASPLRKLMLDSNLGDNLTGGGFGSGLQAYFALGLKGVMPEHVADIEPLVIRSIERIIADGVATEQLEAAINTVEFRFRENNTGGFPRGLSLMLAMSEPWLYGRDILAALQFTEPLNEVKARLADPARTGQLLQRMLMGNSHRLTLTVYPDSELNERLDAQEAEELAAVAATLTSEQRARIESDAERLRIWQESPDDPQALARIPRLSRDDIESHVKHTPLEVTTHAGIPWSVAPLFTSGIAYVNIGFDLLQLPHDAIPYLPLFARAMSEAGAGNMDNVALSQRIGIHTGGINASMNVGMHRVSRQAYGVFMLSGKATVTNITHLADLMRQMLEAPHLHHKERILQMVREDKAGREASLLPSGHVYINHRLRAPHGVAQSYAELVGGVSYVRFIRALAQRGADAWPDIEAQLWRIHQALIQRQGMRVHVTVSSDDAEHVRTVFTDALQGIKAGNSQRQDWPVLVLPASEGLLAPAQVNYVGVGATLESIGYACRGADIVVNRHLGRTFLHDRIREQGGAYGAFSVLDIRSGILTMLSYRDPNTSKTLDVYRQAGEWLQQVTLDDEALLQAIIGTIGDIDGHQLPDARGFSAFVRHLAGDDDQYRQQVRESILAVNRDDFVRYGSALTTLSDHWRVVLLGGESNLSSELGLTERTLVL